MPSPNKGESKADFIKRAIPIIMKEGKNRKEAVAIANSMFEKGSNGKGESEHNSDHGKPKNKELVATFKFVKVKESEDGEPIFTFVAANTLPDRTKGESQDGTPIKGEILAKLVLDKAAAFNNDLTSMGGEWGSYRTISLFHDRVYENDMTKEEAGFVIPGSAIVQEISGNKGNFELLVDVEVNKFYNPTTYPDYTPEKIRYKIEKGALGLSLEYNNLVSQETIVEVNGEKYAYIQDMNDFRGYGFARPNLIGNTGAVPISVKEISISEGLKTKRGTTMEDNEKLKEAQKALDDAIVKNKELAAQIKDAKEGSDVDKLKAELKALQGKSDPSDADKTKIKELELKNDAYATKIKESIERAFSSVEFKSPAQTADDSPEAKVKEVYTSIRSDEKVDFDKFKRDSMDYIEANESYLTKFKELVSVAGQGFAFEQWQTVEVKCKGSQMIVVPTPKTKAVIDAGDMAEGTYNQTNAMFADRYVAGITETFLSDDTLLTALNKEQHLGGNDLYQWRIWTDFVTVSGTNTLSVDPNVTSVARTQRNFEKMQSRIVEYRDGIEVTDFTQFHSMAAIGDLLGLELERAAKAVTESMNADLFKGNTEATTGWNGFIGLRGFADSSTNSTVYGKVRSTTNRLLDGTLANTYSSTSEAISIALVRAGYELVLEHGSQLGDLVIVMNPRQARLLFDAEDAAIRFEATSPRLTMAAVDPSWGFARSVIPHLDGIPIIRDYHCESSAAARDMFAVVDMSLDKGLNLVVSKPLSERGLAKIGASESAYVSFWGAAVYKSPRNVFVHDSLTT